MLTHRSGIFGVTSRTTPVCAMARFEELFATAGVKTGKGCIVYFCLCGKGGEEILGLLGPGREGDTEADQESDT